MKINDTSISDEASVMCAAIIRECNRLVRYRIRQRQTMDTIADQYSMKKATLQAMYRNDECPSLRDIRHILNRELYVPVIYDDTKYYGTNIIAKLDYFGRSKAKLFKDRRDIFDLMVNGDYTGPFLHYCEYAHMVGVKIGIIKRAIPLTMATRNIVAKLEDAYTRHELNCEWRTNKVIEFVSNTGTITDPVMGSGHGIIIRFNPTEKVLFSDLESKGLFLYTMDIDTDGTYLCKLPDERYVGARYYVATIDRGPIIPPVCKEYHVVKIVLH